MHINAILLLAALLTLPLTVAAEEQRRVAVVVQAREIAIENTFRSAIAELGWTEGRNLTLIWREFGDDVEKVPPLAADALKMGVDLFLVPSAGVASRVRLVTATIPIIVTSGGDLVAAGLAKSLARPGGNVTGVQVLQVDLSAKRLALLRETIPQFNRLGLLMQVPPTDPDPRSAGIYAGAIEQFESAAQSLDVDLETQIVRDAKDLPSAFASLRSKRVQAVVIFGNAFMYHNRRTVLDLAMKHQMPALADGDGWISEGAFMAYYTPSSEFLRLAARAADKVLRGANPAEVPIQQPTTVKLAVSLRTARSLTLTIPRRIVEQADEVLN